MPRPPTDTVPLAELTIGEGDQLTIDFSFAVEPRKPNGERRFIDEERARDSLTIRNPRAIEEAWSRAGRALTALATSCRGHADSAADLREPLRLLRNAGITLGQRLTDQDNDKWVRIQQAFTESRLLRGPLFDWANPPVVNVVAYGNGFPVELLPVFLPTDGTEMDPGEISNDDELMRMAETFLGFSAVIRRISPDRQLHPATIANDPALSVQLFRFRDVDAFGHVPTGGAGAGFAREVEFLADLSKVSILSVDGPWPLNEDENQVQQRLVDALFDPEKRLVPGAADQPVAALAHFACHCYTTGDIEDFKLLLSTEDGAAREVPLETIKAGYSDRGEWRGRPRPAIVFNACGSSTIDPLSSLSFQKWFLSNRHPAFLGTHAAIPDEIAADFAEFLYRFLIGGFPFGTAVLLARRQLLLASKNPLGILYLLHGNDQLTVEIPRRGVLPQDFQTSAGEVNVQPA